MNFANAATVVCNVCKELLAVTISEFEGEQTKNFHQIEILMDKWFVKWLPACVCRSDSRLAPSQWETLLQSNAVSHWLGTNLESSLKLNQPWDGSALSFYWNNDDFWLLQLKEILHRNFNQIHMVSLTKCISQCCMHHAALRDGCMMA